MATTTASIRFDVIRPDQPRLSLRERIYRRWDAFLQAIDVFAPCGLSLCGSGVQWDLVDRERAFAREVNEEHGYVYDRGHIDSLSVLIRDHEQEFGYRLDPAPAQRPAAQPQPPAMSSIVPTSVGLGQVGARGLVPVPVRARRRRCHVSAPIVAKLVAAVRSEIGAMCLRCRHQNIDDVRDRCSANYQAAQWTALRIMKDRKMHPEQIQLYLNPTLVSYFYAEQFSHGFGGYWGDLGGDRPPSRLAEP